MNFSTSKQYVRPPQRGIFPLDHDAECRPFMEVGQSQCFGHEQWSANFNLEKLELEGRGWFWSKMLVSTNLVLLFVAASLQWWIFVLATSNSIVISRMLEDVPRHALQMSRFIQGLLAMSYGQTTHVGREFGQCEYYAKLFFGRLHRQRLHQWESTTIE
jgi:hypothetical protein